MPLIQSLPDCPLDIIGDVHGQFEALQNLLHYLGYSPAGKHPQGRKLVFVGDLIDRGPDSPAVADWAKQAIRAGNAFMAGQPRNQPARPRTQRRLGLVF